MSNSAAIRAAGYAWGVAQPPHTLYDELAMIDAYKASIARGEFLKRDKPNDDLETFEKGVLDSRYTSKFSDGREMELPIFLRDDVYLGVVEAADRIGVNRSFIKAEIKAKRLKALILEDGAYAIHPYDFIEWVNSPKRGSRKRKPKADHE